MYIGDTLINFQYFPAGLWFVLQFLQIYGQYSKGINLKIVDLLGHDYVLIMLYWKNDIFRPLFYRGVSVDFYKTKQKHKQNKTEKVRQS